MRIYVTWIAALILSLLATVCMPRALGDSGQEALLKAFPSAEGFGACTPGGRGGQVLFVTTLEDYIPGKEPPIEGSLRAAVSTEGPRYVLFRVGGTIALKADLPLTYPYITIAGSTAPGGGICLKGYQLIFNTHDIVARHLRVRSGDIAFQDQIPAAIFGGRDLIIDHCSISWATDEVLSAFGTRNMTVQWSIIAEGLSRSVHPKGEHSKGSILDGDGGITMHHCLYAHNASRNPRVNTVLLDFRNNVIYNWGYRAGYTRSDPCYVNYVGNYLKPGPNTTKSARTKLFAAGDDMARLFLHDNILEGFPRQTQDNSLLLSFPKGMDADALRPVCCVSGPFRSPTMPTDSPEQAFENVLKDAGAVLPRRDSADARLMEEVRSGTGRIIDSQSDVGGWPELANEEPPKDTDDDGIPDVWEASHELNANDASDVMRDEDQDGYPNLEEFLNDTNPREAEMGSRIEAITFRAWQDDAVALCAQGRKEVEERKLAQAALRKVRREELVRTTKVSVSPANDPNAATIVLDLGGKASLELIRIPAGSFMMGSPESEGGGEDERPQHKVTLSKPFYMAATPTTGAQYVAVMGEETRATTPENRDLPASETTWFEAREFCELLSAMTGRTFRLPTEAEWEYACRAGTSTAFYTGDTISTEQANFDGEKPTRFNQAGVYRGKITAVKTFPPNPWGLYDMPGNQSEYCLDVFDPKFYSAQEVTDPVNWRDDGARVMRGGKHGSQAYFLRSACRMSYAPGVGYGFRVVMEAE